MRKLALFLLSVLCGSALCAGALVATYDAVTAANRRVPYSYSQFLLERIPAPRIVIDAGSSSAFGIEPGLLEQAFRTPVIDVADNGSIPLEMKVHRLLKYAREGDTLILPLEWVYYTRDAVPQDFVDKTPDEYAAYYASLPWTERLSFVVGHASLHNLSDAVRLFLRGDLAESHYGRIDMQMSRSPLGDWKDDSRRRSSVEGISCAVYIAASGRIVPGVTWAARQLALLQARRGVHIYLTWPAVAGRDCYDLEQGRLPLAQEARAIFQRHGLAVVGEVEDSYFTAEHMLDTYYHVDSSAAHLRTERLIARLKTAGLSPAKGAEPTMTTPELAREALRSYERRGQQLLRRGGRIASTWPSTGSGD
jgi:hypothetical protein